VRIRLLPPDRPEIGWIPYAWLVYTPLFLVRPLLGPASPAEQAVSGLAFAAFLALYFRGWWLEGWRLFRVALGIAALGALLTPFNYGASTFFIYAAAFFGNLPRAFAVRSLAGLVLFVAAEGWATGWVHHGWSAAAAFSVLIGGVNLHFAEVSRKNAHLRRAHAEIEHLAKVAERERIARDLHDLLGHTLSLIVLKSELASKLAGRDTGRAIAEIREVERISRSALAEVREAVRGYLERGWGQELEGARRALEAAGIRLETEVEPVSLSPLEETVLSLALREGVTNVVRHSGARLCQVRLGLQDGGVRLELRDDGRGAAGAAEGTGLQSMRERLAELGGRLRRSEAGGSCLEVTLPLGHEWAGAARAGGLPEAARQQEAAGRVPASLEGGR
jgi:two-component system, NarL family, sensor histidine kinase DesK